MTLPRLRVRELLFLVVYAALIGQAMVLSYFDVFPLQRVFPSSLPGHVWITESYRLELLSPRGSRSASPIPFHLENALRRVLEDGRPYYLVPEEAAR